MKYSRLLALLCAIVFFVPISTMAMLPSNNAGDVGRSTGAVGEVIDVPSYTYLWLEDKDIWLAAPTLKVAKGDQVEYTGGMEMGEFYSRALDRTFDSISFVQHIEVVKRDIQSMHSQAMQDDSVGHEIDISHEAVETPEVGEIARLDGGRTIEEIIVDAESLDGQQVSLRARVLKVNLEIAGKNWVTLSDGTGEEGANTLLATTGELPAAGDVVIATGTLGTDIDIGSGYLYEVLLQDATFITKDG